MRVINSLCQHFRDFRLVLFFSTKYQQDDKCNEFPSIDITYTFLRVDSDSTGQYSLLFVFFSSLQDIAGGCTSQPEFIVQKYLTPIVTVEQYVFVHLSTNVFVFSFGVSPIFLRGYTEHKIGTHFGKD